VPQLIENFRNGNAEGISTAFLLTWLVGDIANLVGEGAELVSYSIA